MQVTFDLETLGNSFQAPIVQIAACAFELDTSTQMEFDARIDLSSCFKGFTADLSTIEWWISQPKEVQSLVFRPEGRIELRAALAVFTDWITQLPGKKKFWSHATFDPPILINAYKKIGMECPIHYRDFMDIRTLNFLAGEVEAPPREDFGAHHDAAADCRYQAAYIRLMQNKLKGKK